MGVVYADTLTVLYESVARALDSHQQLVFSCYGETHYSTSFSHCVSH